MDELWVLTQWQFDSFKASGIDERIMRIVPEVCAWCVCVGGCRRTLTLQVMQPAISLSLQSSS